MENDNVEEIKQNVKHAQKIVENISGKLFKYLKDYFKLFYSNENADRILHEVGRIFAIVSAKPVINGLKDDVKQLYKISFAEENTSNIKILEKECGEEFINYIRQLISYSSLKLLDIISYQLSESNDSKCYRLPLINISNDTTSIIFKGGEIKKDLYLIVEKIDI